LTPLFFFFVDLHSLAAILNSNDTSMHVSSSGDVPAPNENPENHDNEVPFKDNSVPESENATRAFHRL